MRPADAAAAAVAAFAASAAALFFPKLSFHFDGFFVTGAGIGAIEAAAAGAAGCDGVRDSSWVGTGYILTGSKGMRGRETEPERCEDDLDAMLISRASD